MEKTSPPEITSANNEDFFNFNKVLGALKKSDEDFSLKELQNEAAIANRKELIHQDGWRKYYKLRDHWSWMIFGFITVSVLFQITLTFFVGWSKNNFLEHNQNFLYVIVGENFGQIIGMGYVAVRFLFNDHNGNVKK